MTSTNSSSKLLHRNQRAVGNHSLYQSNLLSDHHQLLTDIKTNTSNMNINTDTLEALQTTANTHLNNSLTKLTNLQTINDTKLSSIQNFLDKDHAQFHLKHHPDDHHVMLAGNTSADGTGTKNHAHVDGSGILKVSQVSTQNIDPANTSNADHASHSKSLAVGLRGRTTITDETTGKFLLCNSTGELVNNPYTKTADSTHASVAVTIAGSGVDGQITLGDSDNYVRYMVQGISFSASLLYVEGSNDNSNFIRLGQVALADVNGTFHGSLLVENPPKYLRLKNYDLSAAVVKIQAIYGRK